MLCKWCANSKRNKLDSVYCLLFGIMIHHEHRGCKYFKEKDEGNDNTPRIGDKLDDSAAKAERRRGI